MKHYLVSDSERQTFLQMADNLNIRKKEFNDQVYTYVGYLEGLVQQASKILKEAEPDDAMREALDRLQEFALQNERYAGAKLCSTVEGLLARTGDKSC